MSQEGVIGTWRKFIAEYKREAVAMLEASGVTVSQTVGELGIGANVLGRGRWELRRLTHKLSSATGDPGMES